MGAWTNRTVLSGSSTAANGTASHTCTFTAATAGNLLIAVVNGAVTFTTPAGWTLVQSAVNFTGLYVFSKTASAAEASFSTTHNGSDYAILGVVYEYAAGWAVTGTPGTATAQNDTQTGPDTTSLSGTYSRFAVRSWAMATGSTSASTVWTTPTVEDYDAYVVFGTNDGVTLTIAYDDSSSGSSFTPSSTLTRVPAGASGEGISFALSPPAALAPSVATSPVTAIAASTATGNGNVIADGGDTITERGVCWSTSFNPTTASSKATAAGTTGTYSASITGLSTNTKYYVRAYAINSIGTSYGDNVPFTHLGAAASWLGA